jgi:hypothetical protein
MGVQEAIRLYKENRSRWVGRDEQREYMNASGNSPLMVSTNSEKPFHAAIPAKRILEGLWPDCRDRYPFNNHAFLCYINNKGNQVALDACIGPAVGNESIEEYLNNYIDNSEDRSCRFYPKGGSTTMYTIDADHHLLRGITAIDNSHSDKTYEFINDIPGAVFRAQKEWEALAKVAKVGGITSVNVNLAEFFDQFKIAVKNLVSQHITGAQDLKFRLHRPRVKSSKDEGVFFHQAGLDVMAKQMPRPLVSLSLRVLPTAERAVTEVKWYLMSLSRELGDLFKKGSQGGKMLGHLYLEAKEPSRLTIFVYGNMMVYLDGTIDGAAMKSLAAEAEKQLNAATGDHPIIADYRIDIKAPQKVAINEEFDVTVTVSLRWKSFQSADRTLIESTQCDDASSIDVISINNVGMPWKPGRNTAKRV